MAANWRIPTDIAHSYRTLERTAAAVRVSLGFDPTERLPVRECMGRLSRLEVVVGPEVLAVAYGVRQLRRGVEGTTYFDPAAKRLEIDLSIETYRALMASPWEEARARFSFFHELGHAVLHGSQLQQISKMAEAELQARLEAPPILPVCRDPEWQANAFASALMMPAAGLELLARAGRLSVEVVRREFQVSRSAAGVRLDIFWERRPELLAIWSCEGEKAEGGRGASKHNVGAENRCRSRLQHVEV